jgi:NTE family protein
MIVVGGREKRLLDEVDDITSVSGGSFTSAYYGLFGDRIFTDFEERFLRRNVERQLILRLFNPINWVRMASSSFDRTEVAIRLYDGEIFDRKTFADLAAAGGPFLQINATDLAVGAPFTFFQPQFDLLCSDLSTLHVARAVAASSAVPGLFSPTTLRNYAGQCGYQPPPWLGAALADRRGSLRRWHLATIVESYLDGKRPYIHLVDGGVSDNLGLRVPLNNVVLVGGARTRLEQLGNARPSHIVMIVVDAEVHPKPRFSLTAAAPSIGTVLGAVTGSEIYSYNFETLDLMHESLERWARELPPDARGRRAQAYMPEVAFEALPDASERDFFNGVPTSFTLPDETVDRLIAVGRRLLRDSPDFQRLVAALSPSA